MRGTRLLIAAIVIATAFFSHDASAQRASDVCPVGAIGTPDHVIACLTAHFFNSKKGQTGLPILPDNTWSCVRLFDTYAGLTGNKTPIKVDCRWLAELFSKQLPDAPPDWAKCTGYEPNNPAHVAACLQSDALTGSGMDSPTQNVCGGWQHVYRLRVADNNEQIAFNDSMYDPRPRSSSALVFPARRIPFVEPACAAFQPTIDAMNRRMQEWNLQKMIEQWETKVRSLPRAFFHAALLCVAGIIGFFGLRLFLRAWQRDKLRVADLVSEKTLVHHAPAIIAGAANWSETHVSGSSSGGGGYIGPYGGTVSAPSVTVSSTVKSKHQFFLVYDKGLEVPITITDLDFPTRDGQIVDSVMITFEDRNPIVLVYSRATRRHLHYYPRIAEIAGDIWPSDFGTPLRVLLAATAAAVPIAGVVGDLWVIPAIGIAAALRRIFISSG